CNTAGGGSNPSASSPGDIAASSGTPKTTDSIQDTREHTRPARGLHGRGDRSAERIGEVAEWSIAAGCKPAALAATEVRTLPSPPTFARVDQGARETQRGEPTRAKVGGAASFGGKPRCARRRMLRESRCDGLADCLAVMRLGEVVGSRSEGR